MGVRKQAQALREARVMAAARELFTQQGFDRTSMRDIADRAGVSVGTVANAGDKASLLSQMFSDNETVALLGRFACLDSPKPQTSFADEIAQVFDAWFADLDRDPDLVRTYILSLLSGPVETRGRQDFSVIRAIATRLVAHHPSVDDVQARNLALAVYSVYSTMVVAVIIGTFDVEQARRQVHDVVCTLTDQL